MSLLVDTVVPYTAEGPVDFGALRAHLLWLMAHGVDGFAPAATEFLHVDRKEKERILEVTADTARGRPILFNIWDPSPAGSLRLGKMAAEIGARAALLPPPLFVAVREDTVVGWYRAMAEALPLPVYAWQHPGFEGSLSPHLAQRLAQETTVAGWLDSSGELHHVRRQAAAYPTRTWVAFEEALGAGDIGEIAATEGVRGGISRLANAWPELAVRAWRERAPDALESTARRAALLRKAGGPTALRHLLHMKSRLPVDGFDAAEVAKLPGTSFR